MLDPIELGWSYWAALAQGMRVKIGERIGDARRALQEVAAVSFVPSMGVDRGWRLEAKQFTGNPGFDELMGSLSYQLYIS